MYKFNTDNIIVGYIKELLRDFNLPRCSVLPTDPTLICPGRRYLDRNNIITIDEDGNKKNICSYYYNDKIDNLTKNLVIKSTVYDTYTHEYLGDYLRFMRDYNGINLMSQYNCYSNKIAADISFNSDLSDQGSEEPNIFVINTYDPNYKYYLSKVKFGQTYTLGLESIVAYDAFCMIYTGDQVLQLSKDLVVATHKRYPGSSFRNPVLYRTPKYKDLIKTEEGKNSFNNCWEYENYLYLVLKVPTVAKTSIAVLEGDYTLNSQTTGNVLTPEYGFDYLKDNPNVEAITRLTLMRNNAKESYAFSDRLVEYLVGQTITPLEKIKNNVMGVKDNLINLYGMTDLGLKSIYGLWENGIRFGANKVAREDSQLAFSRVHNITTGEYMKRFKNQDFSSDLLGYIDSTTEQFITKQLYKKRGNN